MHNENVLKWACTTKTQQKNANKRRKQNNITIKSNLSKNIQPTNTNTGKTNKKIPAEMPGQMCQHESFAPVDNLFWFRYEVGKKFILNKSKAGG